MAKRKELLNHFLKNKTVNTDTRSVKKGDLFFALKGDNFNGNLYANQALTSGADLVVVDEMIEELPEEKFFLVDDVLTALQNLAFDYRNLLKGTVIGLTGSNGKTTCKELFREVALTTFKTHATAGNLNNHIGVPLTLLSTPLDAEIIIVEMGANHQKEIEALCEISDPDLGYITNFGKAHLEGFGGIEGVIKGKSELYNYLKAHKKEALVFGDDFLQVEKSEGVKRILFGESDNVDVTIQNNHKAKASATYNGVSIQSNLSGDFHFTNIAAAIAFGHFIGVKTERIKTAIESYLPSMNRSEWRKTKKNNVFLDAYNANPDSMLATIEMFLKLNDENKWFVLGDMFELGIYAAQEHQLAVDKLKDAGAENVILVGEEFYKSNFPKSFYCFKSTAEAKEFLEKLSLKDSTILLKGSRGMKLETVLDVL